MNILTYLRVINQETNQEAAKRLGITYVRYNALTKEGVNPFDRLYYREVLRLCKAYHIPTGDTFNEKEFTEKFLDIFKTNTISTVHETLDIVSKHQVEKIYINRTPIADVLKLKAVDELSILIEEPYEVPQLKQSIIDTGQIYLNNTNILGVELYA